MSKMHEKEKFVCYFKEIRERYIAAFEGLEAKKSQRRFERKSWPYTKGDGGGEMSVLRGEVFEKAAVNWSGVAGKDFPGGLHEGPFFASGVSLITHMKNPKMPTVHFNVRLIQAKDRSWIGGGFDLTPMGFPYEEDTRHFHDVAKKCVSEVLGEKVYDQFYIAAKEYFTIQHYQRERGVGGIFFDQFTTGDAEKDFELISSVGDYFLESVMPIWEKRVDETYSVEDQKIQYQRRAQYVEFNLLYDRGTKFGFHSGGNPEAILCSMPPMASW